MDVPKLFELQRFSEVWPSLQGNSQILRDLLAEHDLVQRVWLFTGHLFVSDGARLHMFHQISSGRDVNHHQYHTMMLPSSALVQIIQHHSDTMLLVHADGLVQVLEYSWPDFQWQSATSGYLSLNEGGGGTVIEAIKHGENRLVYSVKGDDGSDDKWNYSIHSLVYSIKRVSDDVGGYCLFLIDHVQILCLCPDLSLYPCRLGVWLIPKPDQLAPPNLLIYWNGNDELLEPFVFNSEKNISASVKSKNFKKTEDSSLISFVVHPILNELFCLTNDGCVYRIKEDDNRVRELFIKLIDFRDRYPLIKSPSNSLQLFILHTYVGICHRGELKLYDSITGEFIWECDDVDHPTTRMISSSLTKPTLPVSLYNQSGIHCLRCKRISNHAQMFVDSLFPIATNADETTPGDYLENGEIVAAELCHLWSLDSLASQYTIRKAFTLVKKNSSGPMYRRHIPPEVLKLLSRLSVQNPIICVALLHQHPMYQNMLEGLLTQFVDVFDNTDSLKTSLNLQAAPLLKKYLELTQKCSEYLKVPQLTAESMPSTRERVTEVLNHLQHSTLSETVNLRADVMCSSVSDPMGTLNGIKDLMKITTSFSEALKELQTKKFSEFELSWKMLLSSEIAEKASKSNDINHHSTVTLPIFELTVQLLYTHEPQDLVHFVTFVHHLYNLHNTSDSTYGRQCHKGYFYKRAFDVMSLPYATSSSDQVHCYCQILLMSEVPSAEIKALHVLLEHEMWSDAVNMLHQVTQKVSPSLHCALFHITLLALSKNGILKEYISSIWSLLPDNFSIHNFIDILKLSDTTQSTSSTCIASEDDLKLQDVVPYILELLSRQPLELP